MLKGCDISHHQGVVNFQSLKDNFDFVIIRATYGDGYKDTKYEINRDGCRNVGLLTGYYHYAYPQYNSPEAEANWFTSIVSCQPGEIIVLDFEENYPTPVDWCKRFLDRAKSNMGFKPYLYINLATNNAYDWSPVVNAGYPLWLARWDYNATAPAPTTDWPVCTLRQYSNQGNVAGINPLDLNTYYGNATEYKTSGNPAPPIPTSPPVTEFLTPDQYFGKYDQKGIDFDLNSRYWCVDNYRQFCKESLNVPQSPPVPSTKDLWTTYLTDYFTQVANTTTNCPIKGDIVIWGTEVGVDGHVAICKDGDPNQFTSFDQNWPIGSLCHFQAHSYIGVLGWLRKKEPTVPEPEPTPPEPEPTPPEPPINCCEDLGVCLAEKEVLQKKITAINLIINGKGWWWIKYAKIKEALKA